MELNRELHVYIDGTEYNIVQGSANLNEAICDTQMSFGDLVSNKFEVNLYNAGNTIPDLSGKSIEVKVKDTSTTSSLFVGKIDSSTKDVYSYDVNIVAYDTAYTIRDTNIADYWNGYWFEDDKTTPKRETSNLKDLLYYLLDKLSITCVTDLSTLININVAIPCYNLFTELKLSDLLRWFGELTLSFPNFNREGKLEFITLGTTAYAISDFDTANSTFEDYTTDSITGVNVYSSSNDLLYSNGGTNNYSITGNLFLLSTSSGETAFDTFVSNLQTEIVKIAYRPCSLVMIVSDLSLTLGQLITTSVGSHYVLNQTFSGSLLVEQTIDSVAYAQNISEQPTSNSDSYIENYKYSSITKDVNGVKTTVGEVSAKVVEVSSSLDDEVKAREKAVTDLQNQIDGAISTWYYEGAPTLTNKPASDWTDDNTKLKHVGDLYYDKTTGYCYRFMQDSSSGTFSWTKISDEDVSKALEAANKAQETADGKTTIFYGTKSGTYDAEVGDYLVDSSSSSTYRWSGTEWLTEIDYANAIKKVDVEYAQSTSQTVAPTSGWSTTAPAWEKDKYIWQRTAIYKVNSTVPSYSDATCIQGAKGEDGTIGKSSYTHIKYGDSLTPSTMYDDPTNHAYIGIYTGESETAPTTYTSYTWAKFEGDKGEDGNGINSITYYYLTNNSSDIPDASAITSTTMTMPTSDNRYLWQKEVIDFTDTSVADKTTVVLLAVYGEKGADGKGVTISSKSVEYVASDSGTDIPSSGWQTTIPTVANGQYLWTRTIVTYSDTTSTTAYSVAYKGTNGEDGASISTIIEEYYLSSSNTEQKDGEWSETCPAYQTGYYYWTRSHIILKDDSSNYLLNTNSYENVTTSDGYYIVVVSKNGTELYTTPVLANGVTDANSSSTSAISKADSATSTAEDAKQASSNAQSTAETAQSTADSANEAVKSLEVRVTTTETTLEQNKTEILGTVETKISSVNDTIEKKTKYFVAYEEGLAVAEQTKTGSSGETLPTGNHVLITNSSFDVKQNDDVVASMSKDTFQTSAWTMRQYNNGNIFNIFKGGK